MWIPQLFVKIKFSYGIMVSYFAICHHNFDENIFYTIIIIGQWKKEKESQNNNSLILNLNIFIYYYSYSQGKPKILQLHSLLGDKETKKNNPQQQQQQQQKNNSGIKRRREMGEVEKEKFDEERQRAIDAYRLAKKRREMKSS